MNNMTNINIEIAKINNISANKSLNVLLVVIHK